MDLITRAAGEHSYGYTTLSDMHGVHAEMLMDFGVLRLRRGETWTETQPLEKAYLLVSGKVRFSWENQQHEEERANCFDVPPTALHVCRAVSVPVIASGGAGCIQDFIDLFEEIPQVDAGLAASIFHFGEVAISDLKKAMADAGIPARLL